MGYIKILISLRKKKKSMFGAYCVQNKPKIEAEHPRATYQTCRLDDLGLACPEQAHGTGPCAGTGLWRGVGRCRALLRVTAPFQQPHSRAAGRKEHQEGTTAVLWALRCLQLHHNSSHRCSALCCGQGCGSLLGESCSPRR